MPVGSPARMSRKPGRANSPRSLAFSKIFEESEKLRNSPTGIPQPSAEILRIMMNTITPTKKQLLVFGCGLSVILSFICDRLFVKYGWGIGNWILISSAIGFLLTTIVNYQWLKPVYIRWMWVAQKIGHVTTTVIMIILFCLVFIPVGILLRILKKDFLNRSIDPSAVSYWNIRKQGAADPKQYTQQF